MSLTGRSILSSERLQLEPVQATDAADFYALWSSPELAQVAGIDPVGSTEDVAAGLAQFERLRLLGMYWKWRLSRRDNQVFVGEIEVYPLRPQIQPWTEWGIGYSLMPHHWRQGLATEALVLVIEAVFMHPEAMRIKADVDASNAASIRLLQRLNFSQEGVQKDKIWHSNRAHDMLLFGLTRNGWQLNHR